MKKEKKIKEKFWLMFAENPSEALGNRKVLRMWEIPRKIHYGCKEEAEWILKRAFGEKGWMYGCKNLKELNEIIKKYHL